MALTNARMKAMVDTELALSAHSYIAFSENGTTETTKVARLAVSELGGWTTPTAADPYEPANTSAGQTDVASGDGTMTHWATCASGTEGTADLGTIWIPISGTDPAFVTGGRLSIAAGALKPCVLDRTTTS